MTPAAIAKAIAGVALTAALFQFSEMMEPRRLPTVEHEKVPKQLTTMVFESANQTYGSISISGSGVGSLTITPSSGTVGNTLICQGTSTSSAPITIGSGCSVRP